MKKRYAFLLLLAGLFCHYSLLALPGSNPQLFKTESSGGCTQTSECFAFTYKGFQVSADGKQVTLSFSIQTNCNRDLSYAAFELPSGGTATATGSSKFQYKTSITNNPFPSIKFEGVNISGYKDGVTDDFSYVISKEDFDKLTTVRVQAKAATIVGTVSFNKVCAEKECIVSDAALSNIKVYVNGNVYSKLDPSVVQGKPVKVCFTVAASAGNKTYSLVSYKAPYPVFVREEAHLQQLFDYETIVVGPAGGTFCMEVSVPDCYYQVDFVKGCIIEQLGPQSTNPGNFYGVQRRLLDNATGGTTSCIPDETTGNEGCTPGYWKQDQHFGNWAPLVPTGANATKFFDVFTVCDMQNNNCSYQGLPANLTLLEALSLQGGGFSALARHAAAAYLNAASDDVAYGIKKVDVVKNVIDAFKTGNSGYKATLEAANEKYCPLSRSTITSSASANDTNAEEPSSKLTVTPNPFTAVTNIRLMLGQTGNYSIALFNDQGRPVRTLKTGNGKAGETHDVRLAAAGLKPGLYMVQLTNGTETQTTRILLR